MKKIISVLVACVMVLSVMTMSVGASVDTATVSGTLGLVWTVSNNGVTEDIANFRISTTSYYSGPYSLKLERASSTTSNKAIAVKVPVTLEAGKTYRINFKSTELMTSGNARQRLILGSSATGWVSGCRMFSKESDSENDRTNVNRGTVNGLTWYEHTFDYTATSENLYLSYQTTYEETKDRYFDDFNISEVDGADTIALDLANGSFDLSALPVAASDKEYAAFSGWTDGSAVGSDITKDRAVRIAEGYNGGYSAQLVYEGGNADRVYVRLEKRNVISDTSKDYTIKFKVKGNPGTQFFVGLNAPYTGSPRASINIYKYIKGETASDERVNVTDLEDGWKQVTMNQSGLGISTTLVFYAAANNEICIDDVEIHNDTDSIDVAIENGDFEAFYFDKQFDINTPNANGGNGQIVISWYNPKSIALYDIQVLEDGEEIDASSEKTDWDLTKNGFNRLIVTGLNNGETHTYTIRAFKTEETYTDYEVFATVDNDRYYYPETITDGSDIGWDIQYSSGTDGIVSSPATGLYIDDRFTCSGSYSLRAELNKPMSADRTYVILSKKFNSEEGKTYRISFMAKGADVASKEALYLYDSTNSTKTKIPSGSSAWAEYTRTCTATQDKTTVYIQLNAISDKRTRSIWIDDVKVQEVLAGDVLGENILDCGDFEREIANLTELNGVLSWDTLGVKYDYVNIYEKKQDGSLEKITEAGEVTGSSYLLRDAFDEEKTYVIKCVVSAGGAEYESEGIEITVDGKYTVQQDEKYEKVTFEDGFSRIGEGAIVEKKIGSIESGNIMSSTTIKNVFQDTIYINYYTALYKNGILEDCAGISKGISSGSSETLSAVLVVDDITDGIYRIKTFLWDNEYAPMRAIKGIEE